MFVMMYITIYKMAALKYLGLSSSNSLFLYLHRLLNKQNIFQNMKVAMKLH